MDVACAIQMPSIVSAIAARVVTATDKWIVYYRDYHSEASPSSSSKNPSIIIINCYKTLVTGGVSDLKIRTLVQLIVECDHAC